MIEGEVELATQRTVARIKMGSRLRASMFALLVVLLVGAGASAEPAGRREADIRARVRAMTNRAGVQTSSTAQLISVRRGPPPPPPASRPIDNTAATTGGWLCVEREAYPACSAGVSGLCQPISCAEMVSDEQRGGEGRGAAAARCVYPCLSMTQAILAALAAGQPGPLLRPLPARAELGDAHHHPALRPGVRRVRCRRRGAFAGRRFLPPGSTQRVLLRVCQRPVLC